MFPPQRRGGVEGAVPAHPGRVASSSGAAAGDTARAQGACQHHEDSTLAGAPQVQAGRVCAAVAGEECRECSWRWRRCGLQSGPS